MKSLLTLLFVFGLLTTWGQCLRSGNFVAADPDRYAISGDANFEIHEDSIRVVFQDNFSTVQGLDLDVFLAKTDNLDRDTDIKISAKPLDQGSNLGTPITGKMTFEIDSDIELEDFDYIIVQCVTINEPWGHVALGEVEGECEGTISSIRQLSDNQLKIYPNPTNDWLNIQSEDAQITAIQIYDLTGKEVFSTYGLNNNAIDISSLEQGIYWLKAVYNGDVLMSKILKL
ncbi:MAG: T9SS type A sorting domain-containing protein [Bacteroidota bacterium]